MRNRFAKIRLVVMFTVCALVSAAAWAQPNVAQVVPASPYRVVGLAAGQSEIRRLPQTNSENIARLERTIQGLQDQVTELNAAHLAQETATRNIIQQSLIGHGSNINEFVIFGGTLEVAALWAKDFDNVEGSDIILNTAELDFEIQVNPWTLGSIIFEYDDGVDVLFPTTEEDEFGIERINVDTAFLTIGDTAKCWPYATIGRVIVPFGISTGDPVADALTIEDPLTIEVFETKEDVILLGFQTPTGPPPRGWNSSGATVPHVKPLLIAPFFRGMSDRVCPYIGCYPKPKRHGIPITYHSNCPIFGGAIYAYNGETNNALIEDQIEHFGATLGYRVRGYTSRHCLPWTVDVDVDFNNSVFDSQFLEFEYRHFLEQFDEIPGLAAHIKSNYGPVSLVYEWNAALDDADFVDDTANAVSIRPRAWQVQLAYQFDWNEYVEVIGAQGTYVVVGYSESSNLAGVSRVIGADTFRVGAVPRNRFLVGFGEWVTDGLRVAVEYAHITDYAVSEGGTGNTAHGVFTQITYEW